MTVNTLDDKLLTAHVNGDMAALVTLYFQAGQQMLETGQIDAGCFYLTHAYIFALESGDKTTAQIHRLLVKHGREK